MDKVIELARKAAAQNGDTLKDVPEKETVEFIQAFYTLSRADYETKLSAVMPADFKDWHENNRSEWPDIAAWVITNLREQRADLEHQLEVQGVACMSMSKKMVAMEAENAKLRQALQDMVGTFCWGDMNAGEYGAIEAARAALGEK